MSEARLDQPRSASDAQRLDELFAAEPDRLARLVVEERGIRFDFSKTHSSRDCSPPSSRSPRPAGLAARARRDVRRRDRQPDRGPRRRAYRRARAGRARERRPRRRPAMPGCARLIDAIEAEAFGAGPPHPPHRHRRLGAGARAAGRRARAAARGRYDVAIVSNVDGAALEEAVAGFDPDATLVVDRVQDLHHHRDHAQRALGAANGWRRPASPIPIGRVIALTAAPEKAIEFGVDETRILPFSESVGGRYSLWSSIGFPAALALGWDAFESLLEGAAAMDRHFRFAPLEANAPVLAAFVDRYYANVRGAETRAVFAYDERLRLLPVLSPAARDGIERQERAARRRAGRPRRPRRSSGAGSAPTPSMRSSSCSTRARTSCRSSSSPRSSPATALDAGASPPAADQLLRPGRGADGGRAARRSAPRLSRRPAVDDDPARPARSARRSAR